MTYYGKKEIFNPELHQQHRSEVTAFRDGAVFNAFTELEGIVNKSELARQYFGRSQSWLSQRIHGSMIGDRKARFSADEARRLADAFRDLAARLTGLAAEIEAAADID